jgi:5-methylcytosine-specific restriction protein B
MSETRDRVVSALAAYDPGQRDRAHLEEAERERAEIHARFPRERWPDLPLADYAVGLKDESTYCRRIEFGTAHLGSIKGGSSAKLLIYKHASKDGWYYDAAAFDSVEDAWKTVRDDFVRAMNAAARKDWSVLADLDSLRTGPALLVKTLHVYFKDRVLPISSSTHLRHFLGLLDRPEAADRSLSAIQLNLALLDELHAIGGYTRSTNELERFLYGSFSPESSAVWVKISSGRDGVYWEQFLAQGIIAVGWERIGDLREFGSKAEFKAAYVEAYSDAAAHVNSRKANSLWRLTELKVGDRIVANRGKSHILAVGTVVEPLYEYRPEREFYRHVVNVDWDTSYAKVIEPQNGWLNTIDNVSNKQRALIEKQGSPPPELEVEPRYGWFAEALEAKRQIVLYGPPGTGKTFHARRFASWWLRRTNGQTDPEAVFAGGDALAGAERRLQKAGQLTFTTFHPSYGYEDFVEGFRPVPDAGGELALALEDGVFKRMCRAAHADPGRPYLLVVDEINRANVAKVFGELITLLEADKRGLEVTLPQSKERFHVPENVFLLGTMNTADRSITLMDVALRRRFAFIELMPEPEQLEQAVGPLKLEDFLAGLNREVARVAGREKQIGHAYLMPGGQPVADAVDFARVFRLEMLPLLQEYCYEEYGLLESILGSELVDVDAQGFRDELLQDPQALVQALASRFAASAAESDDTQ